MEPLWGLNKLMHAKHVEQCLAHGHLTININDYKLFQLSMKLSPPLSCLGFGYRSKWFPLLA